MVSLKSVLSLSLSLSLLASVDSRQLIWHDSLDADEYALHWVISGGVFPSDDAAFCFSASCVGLRGYKDGDDWLIRSTPLPLIPNLERLTSFVVQFDVTLFDIESKNACQLKYKYDTDAEYRTIASFSSSERKHIKLLNQTGSILIDEHKLNASQALLLKLEADGDSSSGGDLCFFDNVYLFGQELQHDIIWSDDLDVDPLQTGWISSNNESVEHINSSEYCSSLLCVEIIGFPQTDNSMYRIVTDIADYFDLFVQFDVHLEAMESANGCQVMYRYDTDEEDQFYLLSSIRGGAGDQLRMQNMVPIPINPQQSDATELHIKLRNNGDLDRSAGSKDASDSCFFDNIQVGGTRLNDSNRAHLMDVYAHNNDHKEHLIIIGDIGGQNNAPYYTPEQATTSEMLSTVASLYRLSGFIALGDNIYDDGVDNEFDPRFQHTFENVYYQTNIRQLPWYFTTGNHDYRKNITGEIEYSKHSERWNFPALYYTKSWFFGDNNDIELLFVALDTYILCGTVTTSGTTLDCIPPDAALAQIQWQWLDATLTASNATFKIVGGHTPIYSYAHHGPTTRLIEQLNPLLVRHNVNAYIFGHDHAVQFIEDNTTSTDNLHHIGSGGGHECRESFPYINGEINPSNDALKYMDCDQGGFVRLTIDTQQVTMQAFYYLTSSPQIQFFSGIWDRYGQYTKINDLLYPNRTRWTSTAEPIAFSTTAEDKDDDEVSMSTAPAMMTSTTTGTAWTTSTWLPREEQIESVLFTLTMTPSQGAITLSVLLVSLCLCCGGLLWCWVRTVAPKTNVDEQSVSSEHGGHGVEHPINTELEQHLEMNEITTLQPK